MVEESVYTCLNMCAANAMTRRENKKMPFLTFLVTLAEELIAEGIQNTPLPPLRRGPQSKKIKLYRTIPLHLPAEGPTRR